MFCLFYWFLCSDHIYFGVGLCYNEKQVTKVGDGDKLAALILLCLLTLPDIFHLHLSGRRK